MINFSTFGHHLKKDKMKLFNLLALLTVFVLLSSCTKSAVSTKELSNEIDSVSYAIGVNMAQQMKASFAEVDPEMFYQGFINELDSTNDKLTTLKASGLIRSYMMKKQLAQQEAQRKEALKLAEVEFASVKKEGEAFLAENRNKEGVQATDSGLQYIVLKQGDGAKPIATDKVKVHYHGTLIDGTVFDSSIDKGKPYINFANKVITGWTEGLQLMNVGSKYRFFIPQELGYGAFPRQGGKIRPFDALIFDVELLEIVKN